MLSNPLYAIDFYKVDHRRQYPKGTTEIYSNLTPRYVKPSHNLTTKFDNHVVLFGIQWFIQDYLIDQWNEGFFKKDKSAIIKQYQTQICHALGLDDFDCSHLEALHDLGYLPIRIKSLPEGSRVPIGVPVLTIVNTHPDFFWLTNYLETIISASLWKPITSATTAFEFNRLLRFYSRMTCENDSMVPYQAHDFSFRGMSGWQDAIVSAAAHLTSFQGSDCVGAIEFLNEYYDGGQTCQVVASSIPATEHSVMICEGISGEYEIIKRLITEVYPTGMVSIVADSYDFWKTITKTLKELHPLIVARDGKVVIRPDSGDPFKVICGDGSYPSGTPQYKGALQCLWELFGGHTNAAGYKELAPCIGLIYGDSITVQLASKILSNMEVYGFASSNIVFGVGSFSYQYVTRDTFGFAMKATSAVVNGERRELFKNPVDSTGGSKRSAKGLLQVNVNPETLEYYLCEQVTDDEEREGQLVSVFENGELMHRTDLAMIRNTLLMQI